jgi:RNA polymerase sigma factor (sigma-70 family)
MELTSFQNDLFKENLRNFLPINLVQFILEFSKSIEASEVKPINDLLKKKMSSNTIDLNNENQIKSLVNSARKGNSSSMEELYNIYYRKIFRIVYSMYPNQPVAEEIANDTFITAFNKISDLQKPESFESWLIGIVINHVRNARRKNKKYNENTIKLMDIDRRKNYNFNLRLTLQKALDQLPEGYRRVLVLYDIHGFSHKEISRILGFDESTSKSQLFKARRRMRDIISSNGDYLDNFINSKGQSK